MSELVYDLVLNRGSVTMPTSCDEPTLIEPEWARKF